MHLSKIWVVCLATQRIAETMKIWSFLMCYLYTRGRLGLPTRSCKETGGFCFIAFTIVILVSQLTLLENKANGICLGERYQVCKFNFRKQLVSAGFSLLRKATFLVCMSASHS